MPRPRVQIKATVLPFTKVKLEEASKAGLQVGRAAPQTHSVLSKRCVHVHGVTQRPQRALQRARPRAQGSRQSCAACRAMRALALAPTSCPPFFQVLDVRLPFDERELLINYTPYLQRTLNLDSLAVSAHARTCAPPAPRTLLLLLAAGCVHARAAACVWLHGDAVAGWATAWRRARRCT